MTSLLTAALLFVAGHFLLSSGWLRPQLINILGDRLFLGFYALVACLSLWWLLASYAAAPKVELWQPYIGFRHIAVSIMPFSCILLIAGYTSANPTAVCFTTFMGLEQGPYGVFRITRHPILWGIALWALSHMLANGSEADLILFGSFAFLSIGGAWHLDQRKAKELGDAWINYRQATSSIPFLAILDGRQRLSITEIRLWRIAAGFFLYMGLLAIHQTVTGMSPLPMP